MSNASDLTQAPVSNSDREMHQLRQELQQKDLLVQQLSEELFRLVKDNAGMSANPEIVRHQALENEQNASQFSQKLAATQDQLSYAQMQLETQQHETTELRQANTELCDRQRELEQVVEELSAVYRAKFAERMLQIKAKVEMLQRENRQLHAELQSLSYRLANRSRPLRLELPRVQANTPALPVLTNV
jgi:chromosome segregation ATPase